MRQFVIDQLSPKERQAVRLHLTKTAEAGPLENMFWLKLETEMLTETQRSHPDCGPFYLAIELGEDSVSFELLVRSQSTLHCQCIAYASPAQREFLLDFIDAMTADLALKA